MPRRNSSRIGPIVLGGRFVLPMKHNRRIAEDAALEFDWQRFGSAARLDSNSRRYIELKRAGVPQSTLAAQLECTLETAKSRILRAVKRLKAHRRDFEKPVRGTSNTLAYREVLSGGRRIWTLSSLAPTFLQILWNERETYLR